MKSCCKETKRGWWNMFIGKEKETAMASGELIKYENQLRNIKEQLTEAQAEIERLKESGAPAQRIRFAQENKKLREQLTLSEAKRAELFSVLEKFADDENWNLSNLDGRIMASKAITSQDKPKILAVVEAAEAVINSYILDDLGSQHPVQKLNKALNAWRGKND